MSGRGRGRGRGGGRGGRGGGPMSASQQYFMASATEAGIDIRNMQRAGLGGGGSVFPDLELHSSGERRLQPHELDGGSEAMRDEGKNDDNMGGGMMMKRESAKRTTSLITKMREMHHSSVSQHSTFGLRKNFQMLIDTLHGVEEMAMLLLIKQR